MISVIICLILMTAAGWALGQIFNRRIEECVPVVITGTIVFLYFFYAFQILFVGRILVYLCYAGLLSAGIRALLKRKKTAEDQKYKGGSGILKSVLTPGVVLFLALSLLFVIYSLSLKPAVWDELRLWAAMPKVLHTAQTLQVGEGSLLYSTMQSYPPGMSLLVYFFTALSGPFRYGSIYAVYWIFMTVLILPSFRKLTWKQWYVLPPVFFLMIVLPFLLTINGSTASGDWNYFYVSLYIDPILGCLMGHAFYQAVKDPFRSGFHLIAFSLTLFLLPALKNTGAIYSCTAFAVAAALFFLRRKERQNAGGMQMQPDDTELYTGKSWFLPIPVLSAGLSYFSWQLIIHTKGTGEFIDFQVSSFTWDKFVNVLKGLATWGNMPFLVFFLFFVIMGLLATFVLKDISKAEAGIASAGFLISFLIFLYGYTSHYGLMLSSIHRYTSTFTFAFFIYLLMRYISRIGRNRKKEENSRSEKKQGILTIVLSVMAVLLILASSLLLFGSKGLQLKNPSWKDADMIVAYADAMLPEDDGAQYDGKHPGRAYLALGGDIRKQSQRHETLALAAISTRINFHNIWCDKLYNEAEDGVIEDPEEMTDIWAESLLKNSYSYVLVTDADEEICYAVERIAPELSLLEGETCLLRIIPSSDPYQLSFIKMQPEQDPARE